MFVSKQATREPTGLSYEQGEGLAMEMIYTHIPDSKIHGTNIGSAWILYDPGGPHVGPMNLAIRDASNRLLGLFASCRTLSSECYHLACHKPAAIDRFLPRPQAPKFDSIHAFNSSLPGQNGRLFDRRQFKCISMNENDSIPIRISLKCVPNGLIDNKSAFVQVMAWRRTCDKPLPEPMLTQFSDAYIRH